MLPMHVHIELAESNFIKAISDEDIRKILRTRLWQKHLKKYCKILKMFLAFNSIAFRPDMLRFFGPKGLKLTSKLLQRPGTISP